MRISCRYSGKDTFYESNRRKMFIARQKKQENIAEYLLYMWQLEDILRSCRLDIHLVEQALIAPAGYSEEQKKEVREWYEGLLMMMKSEGIQQQGHLQINKNLLLDLTDLHRSLLKDARESQYIEAFYKALPAIVEFRSKSGHQDVSELEACFTALYGYLLLKLQKKEISKETETATKQISHLLALLSQKYKTRDLEPE